MFNPGPTIKGGKGPLDSRTEPLLPSELTRPLKRPTPCYADLLLVVGEPVPLPYRLDRAILPSQVPLAMFDGEDHLPMLPPGSILDRGVPHRTVRDPAFLREWILRHVRGPALLIPARYPGDEVRPHRGGRYHEKHEPIYS